MPEYLSKEEVKQWRSSLEKITLEEYAARLGKVIEEDKPTNDLVDIVLKGQPVMSRVDESLTRSEKITTIAQRAFEREKEISSTPFVVPGLDKKQKEIIKKEKTANKAESVSKSSSAASGDELNVVFNKALTDREQMVFDYFAQNQNQVVYAKDLAKLLDLPRDYVYKYIKNLRSKIAGDKLQNSDNGGYTLSL